MNIITTDNLADSTSVSTPKINVGISACLLGHSVRYNGGHTRSKLCLKTLSEHFEYRSFCPEVAAGFGVPRPTLRLVGEVADPRLVFSDDPEQDVTPQFNQAIAPVIDSLTDLDGYILMKNSPSCGLERIKVYKDNGYPHGERTQGLFTRELQQRYPSLPIEEEGRLNDAKLRENFVLRVFAHHHFRQQVDSQLSVGATQVMWGNFGKAAQGGIFFDRVPDRLCADAGFEDLAAFTHRPEDIPRGNLRCLQIFDNRLVSPVGHHNRAFLVAFTDDVDDQPDSFPLPDVFEFQSGDLHSACATAKHDR